MVLSVLKKNSKGIQNMADVIACFMFALGIAHIIFGLKKFKAPIAGAISDGFVAS
jgi:succinate-acetate transporter protein